MTEDNQRDFTIEHFSRMRRLTVDAGWIESRRHNVHGLIEIDVTDPRRIISEIKKRTGESISFTAFIISCLSRAVSDNPRMHAYRDWRGRLITFHDVNVNTMFDAVVDGQHTVLPHIVKAADKKSVLQIHDEIRAAQKQHRTRRNSPEARYIKQFVSLPTFIRHFFYRYIYINPRLLHERYGTVAVTAVGMFGKGGGWGIPFGNHTLSVTVGGIAEKPGVINGEIKVREFLSVTLTMDHDIIDGAPAARFTKQFRELVESSHGLHDIESERNVIS